MAKKNIVVTLVYDHFPERTAIYFYNPLDDRSMSRGKKTKSKKGKKPEARIIPATILL